MELLAIWQSGFYQVCALLGMGTEGAGGGIYRQAALVVVLGVCGVVVMEQVPCDSRCDKGKGGLLPVTMAVVGALQRGRGVVVVRMEARHACGGHG
jgi:hypothetical protein